MRSPTVHDCAPSPWVVRFAPLIPAGLVLDLACGSGRHSRLLAARGLQVVAADRDQVALQALASDTIRTVCIDLEAGGSHAIRELLPPNYFAGVVVTNYLHRSLLPLLFDSLIDGGVLIYETFSQGNAAFGKPSNPDFLLEPGELLAQVRQARCRLHVMAFEDGYQTMPRPAMVQRLCTLRSDGTPLAQALVL